MDPSRVFVVHGRNSAVRDSMFAFLRSIGLKPIEWSQAVALTRKASPYVGEILDAAFASANAVVVLLTGDDEARLKPTFCAPGDPAYEREFTGQARPNVLFEAGLALGSHPNNTVLVQIGELRPFSDVAGRHMLRLTDSVSSRQQLALRLQSAGCPVDISGVDWHTAGIFSLEETTRSPEQSAPQERGDKMTVRNEVDIDEDARAILVQLSTTEGSWQDEKTISDSTHLNRTVVKHYLDEFSDMQYAERQYLNQRGWVYRLRRPGRAYLVRSKLV